MVYRAVVAMVEGLNGSAAEAESIVVINHSICDTEGPFSQRASYWAKLIDHLSHKYRLLFVMSAGNNQDPFAIDAYSDAHSFETADAIERQFADRTCVVEGKSETVSGEHER